MVEVAAVEEALLDEVLLEIERTEMRSLRWGATGGHMTREQLVGLIRPLTSDDPEQLILTLSQRRLLFEFSGSAGEEVYRSRFAEGVRLFASLKQIFPKQNWQAAPNLVADFRVDLRQRRFPRRDQSAESVINELAVKLKWTLLQRDVAASLLERDGEPISLAAFQARATEAVLRPPANGDRGVVISAGTGSGKTLAFYLPAILRIVEEVRRNEFWTKSISLYPRNELLKDQLSEALRFVHSVGDRAARPLRVGSLYGQTPNGAYVDTVSNTPGWDRIGSERSPAGYTCPFLVCPECGGRLIWYTEDIAAQRERLICEARSRADEPCDFETDPDQVALTRWSVRERPPDLLFTSAEMLNQRMSDSQMRRVFGLGQPRDRRPFLMLLDEAHTYEGTSGAQAATVFRRWRHAVASPIRWVGLSATLLGAAPFLEQLTGVPERFVEEVTPADDELEALAADYQLILRGDPLSQAALLSTSIQASFLLARLLDPLGGPSEGRHGHRAFVFTDDLDVTNRLYNNLDDAERQRLPGIRARGESSGRFAAGQDWRAIESVGWDLGHPLQVSRTSSQDAGVNANSELVVATATLEVGFDDNRVGAVLQHKSPHRNSSFIQRKGRAGRTRAMRPWTVTVLSDYGRDRATYQSYERLFDPKLEQQQLPIANGYIRRIQAGFAFLDWMAAEYPDTAGWWWWAVHGPADERFEGQQAAVRKQQKLLRGVIDRLLGGDKPLLASLRRYLRGALGIRDDNEIDLILWGAPRSLLLELLPTLARRLQADWALVQPGRRTRDLVTGSRYPRPLPEFLPPNLFTDLNLPEVQVEERGRAGASEPLDTMLILQALRQLAPGRVTRRFAPGQAGLHHWSPVPLDGETEHLLAVDEYATDARFLTTVEVELNGQPQQIPLYRPWRVELERAPTERPRAGTVSISPTSNATMLWTSQIEPREEPLRVEVAHDPVWRTLIDQIGFYLHDQRSALTVRRFALESEANLRLVRPGRQQPGDGDITIRTRFHAPNDTEQPAAVGFEAEVDGMVVRFHRIDGAELVGRAEQSASLPAWRSSYVRSLIDEDDGLAGWANEFQRDWLLQVYLAAVLTASIEDGINAEDSNLLLGDAGDDPRQAARFARVLDGVFDDFHYVEHPEEGGDADAVGDDDGDNGNGNGNGRNGRLRTKLADLLATPEVVRHLSRAVAETWKPDSARWAAWLDGAVHETLAEAVREAALGIAPDHVSEGATHLDLERGMPGADPGRGHEAWITETAVGGAGVAEAIATAYAEDPRVFFRAFEFALQPGEFELASIDLDETVALASRDAAVRAALDSAKRVQSHDEREEALSALSSLLQEHAIAPTHAFISSLNQRVLRSGSDADTSELLHDLVTFWVELELSTGVALDLRVFATLVLHVDELANGLTSEDVKTFLSQQAGQQLTLSEQVGSLSGLLWPRAHELRRRGLSSWSPFRQPGFTDPALVRELVLRDQVPEFSLADPTWQARLPDAFGRSGVVRLTAGVDEVRQFQNELARLVGQAVDAEYLQFFPVIEQLRRRDHELVATLVLRGVV